MKRDDISSLAHSKWNCKYHVVFAPKYRRMVIYNQIKTDIGKILRKLCEQKGIEIIEAEAFYNDCNIFLNRQTYVPDDLYNKNINHQALNILAISIKLSCICKAKIYAILFYNVHSIIFF